MKYSKSINGFSLVFFYLAMLLSSNVLASSQLDAFINAVSAPTYDCPNPKLIPELLEYLQKDSLTDEQRFRLDIEKAQHDVCIGKTKEAEDKLNEIIAAPNIDKSSDYFADAVYLSGFIQDLYGNSLRCKIYDDAAKLSKGKFHDVNVSARLGYLTECENFSFQQKLSKIYSLLDENSSEKDVGLLAHIYNSLGLTYNRHNLGALAAEQFVKAHKLAGDVYNGSNRLSLLTSAISASITVNEFEQAEELLLEYKEINKEVDTPYTNFVYLLQKSRLYDRQENFPALRSIVEQWRVVDGNINNRLWNMYFRWYEGVVCLHDQDNECLTMLFNDPEMKPEMDRMSKGLNAQWSIFKIRALFFLGDIESAKLAVERYFQVEKDIKFKKNKFKNSLNVAQLYKKIEDLETKVELEKTMVRYFSYLFVVLMILTPFLIYFLVKQKIKRQGEIDPITGLYSPDAVIEKTARLPAPEESKVHALAIFDLANFRDLNRLLGVSKGDLILKEIALTLTTVTRSHDIIGRLSPEQFLVCLTNIEEGSAKSFLERVRKALERTFLGGQHGVDANLQSSMSIFITSEKFEDIKTILDDMMVSLTVKPIDQS